MLNNFIQPPYVKTPLGLATPALILSVAYLICLTIFLIIAQKNNSMKTTVNKYSRMTQGEKNRTLFSMIGYVLFILSCIILSKFLGDENLLLDISKSYLKYETVVYVLLFVFLCTAFFNTTNADAQIKAINRLFHYLIWISVGTGLFAKQIDYLYWKNILVILFAGMVNVLFFVIEIHSTQKESDHRGKFDLIPYGPVKSLKDLFPEHRKQAQDIANIIINSSADPISLCLSGKWGMGKTSIIHGAIEILNTHVDKFVDTIHIKALELDDKNTLIRYLMAQIRDRLKSRGAYVGINSEYAEFVSSITGTITSSAVGTFIQNKLSVSSDYRVQKHALELVLGRVYQNGKLVVIVDDIERCDKDTAREYLFIVKEIATMRNCVSIFVTDYDMLNEIISIESTSTDAPDFLNKFFNYRINLREEAIENILSFYDSFLTDSNISYGEFYRIIHKTPSTWYNEALAGLKAKLEELQSSSSSLRIKGEERERLNEKIAKQQEYLTTFIALMQNIRNVAKFYNLLRKHFEFCEKHLHPSTNEKAANFIESRNIGQIIYFLSFTEVFLPAEYEQLRKEGTEYVDPFLYGVSIIQENERGLLTELFQGLVFGKYSKFKNSNSFIKMEIRKFIKNFLCKSDELDQLINPFTSQEDEWRDAISNKNYQQIKKYWEEMIWMVLQKQPSSKTGITDVWRIKSLSFLLSFAENQVQAGTWTSDKLFSLFDPSKQIFRLLSLAPGFMQIFWEHIEKSNVYEKPSKDRANDINAFSYHYAYERIGVVYNLAHYLIPQTDTTVKPNNLRECLLNSNRSFKENMSNFLSKIADAIPNFSYTQNDWLGRLNELTEKISDFLINENIAIYSDVKQDMLQMTGVAGDLHCLEKFIAWIAPEHTEEVYVSKRECDADSIDRQIAYFENKFNKFPSSNQEQHDFEKRFSDFFEALQLSKGLMLPKEQANRLHCLVERAVEEFGIYGIWYRRIILNATRNNGQKNEADD